MAAMRFMSWLIYFYHFLMFLGQQKNMRKGAEGRHEHRPPIECMRAHCETGEWAVRVTQRSMAAMRFFCEAGLFSKLKK